MTQNPYLTNVALPPWTIIGYYEETTEKYLEHVYAVTPEQAATKAPSGVTVVAVLAGHTIDADTNPYAH